MRSDKRGHRGWKLYQLLWETGLVGDGWLDLTPKERYRWMVVAERIELE